MVLTKAERNFERTAELFRALADETRLGILERLAGGEQCVCDLADALEAGQSRLSFHLRTLKDAGLLRDRRQGRWVYYCLDEAGMEEARTALGALGRPGGIRRATVPCCG